MTTVLLDWLLHLDTHLLIFTQHHGAWVYALLFAVIFIETGLVVMPFLPGDSLLFICGALAAGDAFPLAVVMPLLVKDNFTLALLGIIVASLIPGAAMWLKARFAASGVSGSPGDKPDS